LRELKAAGRPLCRRVFTIGEVLFPRGSSVKGF